MNERDVQEALGCLQCRKYVLNLGPSNFYYIFIECVDDVDANRYAHDIAKEHNCKVVNFYQYPSSVAIQNIFNVDIDGDFVGGYSLCVKEKFTDANGYRAVLIGKRRGGICD